MAHGRIGIFPTRQRFIPSVVMVRGFPFKVMLILVFINAVPGQFSLNNNEPARQAVNWNFKGCPGRAEPEFGAPGRKRRLHCPA